MRSDVADARFHGAVGPLYAAIAVLGVQPANGEILDEESAVRPFGVYGVTKLLCERFGDETAPTADHHDQRKPSPGDLRDHRVKVGFGCFSGT